MGRIFVDDGVDHFPHRDLLLDRVEKADELLMAMALLRTADNVVVRCSRASSSRHGRASSAKLRIARQIERADAIRRELAGLEDTLHRAQSAGWRASWDYLYFFGDHRWQHPEPLNHHNVQPPVYPLCHRKIAIG